MALNLIKKDKSHSVVSIKLDEQEFHNSFKEYYAALCSFAFQYMEDADMSAVYSTSTYLPSCGR
jgi:hypothetical protein